MMRGRWRRSATTLPTKEERVVDADNGEGRRFRPLVEDLLNQER
jgi:hypothetical protein